MRTFGVPVCSTGYRGEQTSPETCTLGLHGHKEQGFMSQTTPISWAQNTFLCPSPVMDGSRGPAAGEAPSCSSHSQEQPLLFALQAGHCFSLSQTLVALSKWWRWGSGVPYSRCWSTYGSFSFPTAHFLNIIILGTKQPSQAVSDLRDALWSIQQENVGAE